MFSENFLVMTAKRTLRNAATKKVHRGIATCYPATEGATRTICNELQARGFLMQPYDPGLFKNFGWHGCSYGLLFKAIISSSSTKYAVNNSLIDICLIYTSTSLSLHKQWLLAAVSYTYFQWKISHHVLTWQWEPDKMTTL